MKCDFGNSEYTGSIIFPDEKYKVKSDNTTITFSAYFNGPVQLPKGIGSCSSMFYSCRNFNYPVTIPAGVKDCNNMFHDCTNFNQLVIIPEGAENCSSMFWGCTSLSYPVIFPKSTTSIMSALKDCPNVSDIYILNPNINSYNVAGLVEGHENASKDITIHCTNLSVINRTDRKSIIYAAITWDENWYNAEYKVQLTTDMNGVN